MTYGATPIGNAITLSSGENDRPFGFQKAQDPVTCIGPVGEFYLKPWGLTTSQ